MSKVHVFDHPLIQHKLSILRDKNTSVKEFRELISEIAMLMCFEATRDLPLEEIDVETPVATAHCKHIAGKKLAIVPILRAGLGMVDGMVTMMPNVKVGHIGLFRDPQTLEPVKYYFKMPPDIAERDVIIVDPPRKGCEENLLHTMASMQPDRIVYVSCDSATLARDVKVLGELGYEVKKVRGVDQFPMTCHVETVVLLSKGEIDSKKVRVEFSLEDMDMSGFQKGATYEQIKAYVLEHTGLKVSSLYISQIKRKCGLDVGQNYNLSKKEDAKVPKCPPEKEAAIRDALKYFQMI